MLPPDETPQVLSRKTHLTRCGREAERLRTGTHTFTCAPSRIDRLLRFNEIHRRKQLPRCHAPRVTAGFLALYYGC